MPKPRSGRVVLLIAGWLFFAFTAGGANPEASFKKGVEALDRGRWQEAARHLREAIAEDPQESDRRIFLSGVFSRPYLPHFYLGQALYNAGRENCEEALREWAISEEQGAITRFRRQLQDLEKGREICNGQLLPAAAAAATTAIERAAALGERVEIPLAEAGLDGQWRSAMADLAEARRRFDAGQAAGRAEDLRGAERQAGEAARALTALSERASSRAPAIQEVPSEGRPSDEAPLPRDETRDLPIQDASDRLPGSEVRSAEETATDLEAADLSRPVPPGSGPRDSAPTLEEPATLPVELNVGGERTGEGAVDPEAIGALWVDVSRRAGSARALLDRIDEGLAGSSGSELLEIQRSRLRALVGEVRDLDPGAARADGLQELRRRLGESAAALRLLAGASAFLEGDTGRAVELLEGDSGEGGSLGATPRLAAHGHLFLAAARFALYHLGEEGEPALLDRVAESVRRCRGLDPELVPDHRTFSPGFREFFSREGSVIEAVSSSRLQPAASDSPRL